MPQFMNDYNTITNANTHSMVLVDHSVRTIRPAMGPGKIIRLQPNQAPKDSAMAKRIIQLLTRAFVQDNPGWLHDAKLTREYVETLLQSVLDHKNGAVFIDVHHTLQGEVLRGALILVHSLDQAKSSSAFKAARDRLLARARSEVEVWRDEDLDLDPQFVEYTPQIELLGVDGRFQGQRVGQRLVSEAERYCVAEHAKPRRPWSTRYVDTILEEGFREDDLVVSLDTTWEPHTPYYEKQGYRRFVHYIEDVGYFTSHDGWQRGEMVSIKFFKRLPCPDGTC